MTPDELMQVASTLTKLSDVDVLAALEALAFLYEKRSRKAHEAKTGYDRMQGSFGSTANAKASRLAGIEWSLVGAVRDLQALVAGPSCFACYFHGPGSHEYHDEKSRKPPEERK